MKKGFEGRGGWYMRQCGTTLIPTALAASPGTLRASTLQITQATSRALRKPLTSHSARQPVHTSSRNWRVRRRATCRGRWRLVVMDHGPESHRLACWTSGHARPLPMAVFTIPLRPLHCTTDFGAATMAQGAARSPISRCTGRLIARMPSSLCGDGVYGPIYGRASCSEHVDTFQAAEARRRVKRRPSLKEIKAGDVVEEKLKITAGHAVHCTVAACLAFRLDCATCSDVLYRDSGLGDSIASWRALRRPDSRVEKPTISADPNRAPLSRGLRHHPHNALTAKRAGVQDGLVLTHLLAHNRSDPFSSNRSSTIRHVLD